ncbi:ParB-like protein [Hyphomicrobium sp. 99]|uniref:ParB-like protein n=1 Tax=Hyphomicrobium sp. 99 TaxID=1163419 RepID=UPI0005F7F33F|nr:ParB-like protein [Hyphomicrobium sp. 99]
MSTARPGLRGEQKLETVPLEDLRPTQMAVGMRAVAAKREKVERRVRSRRKLRRYLEARPIPAVLGPGDDFFIIDHHHLSLALLKSDVEEAFVDVVADLSLLPRKQFLRRMTTLGLLHAYDGRGQPVCPTKLPESLKDLRADPYRDLAWSVREAGGFAKSGKPFAEFRWADFFRTRIPRSTVRRDFEYAHDRAMWLARSQEATRMPGYIGR